MALDPAIVVGAMAMWGTVTAAWLDMRARTNGSGPLAKKLDGLSDQVATLQSLAHRHPESTRRAPRPQ